MGVRSCATLLGLALGWVGLLPCSHGQPVAGEATSHAETKGVLPASAPETHDGTSGKVLQTLTLPSGSESAASSPSEAAGFVLSWLGCNNRTCPYGVAAQRPEPDGKAMGALALDWAAPARARVRAVAWDLSHGAGEPLVTPGAKRPKVWAAGEGEGTVTASARLLFLDGGAPSAVLVSQRAGFEHLKRRHAVYAVVGGQLRKLWSRVESVGPYVSWVLSPPGRPAVHLSVFMQPDAGEPDKLAAHELVWRNDRSVLVERGGVSGLPGVVAGTFDSVAEAQAARLSACLADYWVIDAEPLKWSLPHRYALLLPAAVRAAASAEVVRLKRCQPAVQAKVFTLPRLQDNPFE